MINKYSDVSAYNTAGYPTSESRVALINSTKEVKVDGVNVMTNNPVIGDAVYIRDNDYFFFKGGDALNHTALTTNGYTDVGQVVGYEDDKVLILDKGISSAQYLSVWQYAITAISSTDITINLCMRDNYAEYISTSVTLSSTTLNATTASEISEALNTSGNTNYIGYANHGYWAYYDEARNRIIVQCDFTENYGQYRVAGSGCTIDVCVWEDMPADSRFMKVNGSYSNWLGMMNHAKYKAYWGANGRTPINNETVNGATINTYPVTETAFNNSSYCDTIKAYYSTYDNYLDKEFGILHPQKFGCFVLPHAKDLVIKYGNKIAQKKDGTTVYKFPALHYGLTINYGVSGLSTDDFFLPGVNEGMMIIPDDKMAAINVTRTKMGHTNLSNSSYYWFAQSYAINLAWSFDGTGGHLGSNYVDYGLQVLGMALLEIKS